MLKSPSYSGHSFTATHHTLCSNAANLAAIHLSTADEVLAPVVKRFGPCIVRPRRTNHFHALANSIMSQQLSDKASATIQRRVRARLALSKVYKPIDFIQCDSAQLRAAGLSRAKIRYVKNLAEAVHGGRISFADLRRQDNNEVIESLTRLPGIGTWTAEMFLIFGLGRVDVFSEGDAGLRRAIQTLYGSGKRKLSDAAALRISKLWSPYRSIASWYLWRTLD
jgi:DNA-3-methyladenine glycosylase II